MCSRRCGGRGVAERSCVEVRRVGEVKGIEGWGTGGLKERGRGLGKRKVIAGCMRSVQVEGEVWMSEGCATVRFCPGA